MASLLSQSTGRRHLTVARRIHQRKRIDASLATEVKEVVAGVTKMAEHSQLGDGACECDFGKNLCRWKVRLVAIMKKASDALVAEHGALLADATKQVDELTDQLFSFRFSAV